MAYSLNPATGFTTVDELARYLQQELARIAVDLNTFERGQNVVLYVSPLKPRLGLVVFADGTSWNPGGGVGLYEYTGAGATGWRMLASGVQY